MEWHLEKFDALAVDPELDNRIRIKQATSMVRQFDKFYQSASLSEAAGKLSLGTPIDVVFVSERFGPDSVVEFIRQAKDLDGAKEAAFIMVVSTQDDLEMLVAKNMVGGVDGFLCEPFSVERLGEITEIASRVRKEKKKAREKAAYKFLMHQITEQIDVIAQLKAKNINAARQMRKLAEMCKVFDGLAEDARKEFLAVAVDVFESAKMPKPLIEGPSYEGASSRVRKKLEEKILKQLAGVDKDKEGDTNE